MTRWQIAAAAEAATGIFLDHLVGTGEDVGDTVEPDALAVLRSSVELIQLHE